MTQEVSYKQPKNWHEINPGDHEHNRLLFKAFHTIEWSQTSYKSLMI